MTRSPSGREQRKDSSRTWPGIKSRAVFSPETASPKHNAGLPDSNRYNPVHSESLCLLSHSDLAHCGVRFCSRRYHFPVNCNRSLVLAPPIYLRSRC
ncbi:hypothetical protein T310_8883 [Rasamsonia emersonii CBS 393.64]|uniref:Uncharacterized protein n=1 Tax=Rasamsonia emersonii (strain ATCC 16479 / CBS 393.64 / IMI 116815) TaxID=1408163 RepID=A0A0F4YGU4_RASE3|nr:hypothetical protein T310_8883 [Rasamsonia emersonii CBS 393.64]KKA17315.1 hypothetical protein T310_8883 [Rasamsonia emersonii CBS 393.64]